MYLKDSKKILLKESQKKHVLFIDIYSYDTIIFFTFFHLNFFLCMDSVTENETITIIIIKYLCIAL